MIKAEEFARVLKLEKLVDSTVREWEIESAEMNRPGMQFCGYYNYFAWERPQVIGKVEMNYLYDMEPAARREMLKKYFSYGLPCIIVCRGLNPPQDFLEEARRHDVAVYRTDLVTTQFNIQALNYLSKALAPHMNWHGELLDVYGVGVLLTGKSGVGKSEAALELIKRGHQLVADDVIDVRRESDGVLIGECPEMVRYYMEIRGIGIINIREMFGIGAVLPSKTVDFVLEMREAGEAENVSASYNRITGDDDKEDILGVQVEKMILPMRPGRNVAVIVEVAARNFSLKKSGYNAANRLMEKLNLK